MKAFKYPKPFCPVCGRLHRPTRVYGVPVVLCPAFPSGAFGLARPRQSAFSAPSSNLVRVSDTGGKEQ